MAINSDPMGFLQDADERAYFATMQAQQRAEKEVQEERALRDGSYRRFDMPKKPNGPNDTRVARLRMLVPFLKGTQCIEHGKFGKGGFTAFCPGDLGFDCERCDQVCGIENITREQLLSDAYAKVLLKYGRKSMEDRLGFTTKIKKLWLVWNYDGDYGKGEVNIFHWYVNSASPVQKMWQRDYERYIQPENGQEPLDMTQYDLKLIQYDEGQERTFDVEAMLPSPFDWAKVKDVHLDKESIKLAYAIAMTFDKDWLQKYSIKQKEHVKALAEEKQQARQARVRSHASKFEAVELTLDE